MQPVFSGKVVDCVPTDTGLVFAYCRLEEGKPILSFQMVNFDAGRMMPVESDIYRLAKFGANYKTVCLQIDSYWQDRVLSLPGEQLLILEHTGRVMVLDSNATMLYHGSLQYNEESAAAGALQGRRLWCCYPEQNLLIRYNAATMREELRIGGDAGSPFRYPVDLWIEGDKAYVCNQESMQIVCLDLHDFSVRVFEKLTEPVYRYFRSGAYAFTVTKSGLYLLSEKEAK